jgi:hypothetical protein
VALSGCDAEAYGWPPGRARTFREMRDLAVSEQFLASTSRPDFRTAK